MMIRLYLSVFILSCLSLGSCDVLQAMLEEPNQGSTTGNSTEMKKVEPSQKRIETDEIKMNKKSGGDDEMNNLVQSLKLDQETEVQFRSILQRSETDTKSVMRSYSGDQKAISNEMGRINRNRDAQLKSILTSSQFDTYTKLTTEKKVLKTGSLNINN